MSIRDTVNQWFNQRIATGALARDTEAYNQAVAALPDLISALESAEPQPAPAKGGKAAPVETPPSA